MIQLLFKSKSDLSDQLKIQNSLKYVQIPTFLLTRQSERLSSEQEFQCVLLSFNRSKLFLNMNFSDPDSSKSG